MRRLAHLAVAAAAVLATIAIGSPASAAPADPVAPDAASVAEVPGIGAEDAEPGTFGPNCTSPFCGRIVNRTPAAVEISQNYSDGGGCVGPYEWLDPGHTSTRFYKDTDCVKSYWCHITVDGTGPFTAFQWVRFSNLPWTQEVECA